MGQVRRTLVTLLAAILISVAGTTAAAEATAPDPAPAWTWAELTAEWAGIRTVAPGLPALADWPEGSNRLYVTQTSEQRPWTWCVGSPPCQLLLIALPAEHWQQGLWHEAGHVLHFLYPPDWAVYQKQRGIPSWWQGPLFEVWAEDFRRCYGPADQPDHYFWWLVGEPAAPFCAWMEHTLNPADSTTGSPQPGHPPEKTAGAR